MFTARRSERPTIEDSSVDNDFSGHTTILFNCSCHSFQDVITQLMKAIRCTSEQGLKYAQEIHTKGSAVVYRGPKERCEAVAMTLEQIRLITAVQ